MNPVFLREWKYFFRGSAPYYFLIFYGIIHLLIFLGVSVSILQGGSIYDGTMENTGRMLAGRIFVAQLFFIMLSFPALSVKLITRDHEGATRNLLQIMPYGLFRISCWKLVASFTVWTLPIITIIPLMLFSFSLGGVSMNELVCLVGIILALVLFCGVTGLLCSSGINNPARSLAATYVSVFVSVCLLGSLNYPDSIIMKFFLFSF